MARKKIKIEDIAKTAESVMNLVQPLKAGAGPISKTPFPSPRAMLDNGAKGNVQASTKMQSAKLPAPVPKGRTIGASPSETTGSIAAQMGAKAAQRDLMRDMTRDSMRWHTATSVPERARLFAANIERRRLLGLTYDSHTGQTLDANGNSLSEPVRMAFPTHAMDYQLRAENMPAAIPMPKGIQGAQTEAAPKTDLDRAREALEQARRDRSNGILGGRNTAGSADRIKTLSAQVQKLEGKEIFERYHVRDVDEIEDAVRAAYGTSYHGINDYKNVSMDEQQKADAAAARAKEILAINRPLTDAEKEEAKRCMT